jgi:CRP/FNR family transcriptional regulator, cyclic AMP receptor protein
MVQIDDLRQSKALRNLNDRELEEVAKLGTLWKRPAGVLVIREGSEAAGVYLLQQGSVEVRMTSRDGHEVVIDELGPGDLFGWSSVLDQSAFKAAIWTVGECTLVVMDGRKLRALFDANNHIGYRVCREIAEIVASRLERLRSRLADQPFAEEWLSPAAAAGAEDQPRERLRETA